MAQDNKVRMPSSQAGLTSFGVEYKSRFTLTPTGVLIYIGVLVTIVLLLRVLL